MITAEYLAQQLKELMKAPGDVTIFRSDYERFHANIKDFIYENYFENTPEWEVISNNLLYRSNQYMARHEADIILVEIEKLHRRVLKQDNEAFWSHIHPLILYVSEYKLMDGHYADAVESAMKAINSRLKNIYRKERSEELDGSALMTAIFSPKNPVLVFEDMSTDSGKNVQLGYMQIFQGIMTGIRNPTAHDNLSITRESAIKKLILASLLMDKIDEALIFSSISEPV